MTHLDGTQLPKLDVVGSIPIARFLGLSVAETPPMVCIHTPIEHRTTPGSDDPGVVHFLLNTHHRQTDILHRRTHPRPERRPPQRRTDG